VEVRGRAGEGAVVAVDATRGTDGSAVPMEITFGIEKGFAARPGGPALLRRLAALGATSIETYVRWIDFEPEPGRFDWSVFDADLEALRGCGLRWVPFLIAGPWYATPAWFREGPQSVFFRCLEHGRETGTQSLWNPHLLPEIRRLLGAFAARYRPSGAVESLLLGVTGDYGESIYPVTGNWPGDYHGHGGYWCGDAHAAADFRAWAAQRYGSLQALGAAWGSRPGAWEDVAAPASPARASSPRAWLDFVQWYRGAMTDWSAAWLREARAAWPEVELYLCTGGDMLPAHGSDFSEQCRVAAEAGAGVRITNEGSDYVFNLMLTRLVACAARAHGSFCGFEPAAAITAVGVAARQYNATASGARQLHEYQNNLIREAAGEPVPVAASVEAWERGRPHLVRRDPRWEVGLLLSLPDLALREAGIGGGPLALARVLRPACDFALLDDHLVARGALRDLRAVFLAPCRFWAPGTAAQLRAFVEAGGICVAGGPRPQSLEGADEMGALFGFGPQADELTGISAVHAVDGAPLPAYRGLPRQHLARSFTGLEPAAETLLQLRHTPAGGAAPQVLWSVRHGRGAAVFYAGALAPAGEDWMAVRGAAEALVRDLLLALPPALGLAPLELSDTPGVFEARDGGGMLGWNAGPGRPWRGADLPGQAIAPRP